MLQSKVMVPLLVALPLALAPPATAQVPPAPSLSVDPFFAPPSGIARTDFAATGISPDLPTAVAVDGDRIYTVGRTGSGSSQDVAIVARSRNGTPDSGFSGDGKLTLALAPATRADFGTGLVVLPDGRIRVIAAANMNTASTDDLDVAIVGLLRDGSPDATFGSPDSAGTRRVVFSLGTGNDVPAAIRAAPDGRLAVVGYGRAGSADDVFVSLRNPDGSPATFGTGGVRFFNRGSTSSVNDRGVDVVFRPGGGLLALILIDPPAANDITAVLHAFKLDGADDPAFSGDGDLALAVGSPDTVPSGLIVHGGRLWASGYTQVGTDTDAFIARVNADGGGLQTRRFDMRGRLPSSIQALVSRALDLAVVPGVPPTLVAVGSVEYAFEGSTFVDWAAAAFNNLDGDLARAGFGDIVVQAPGNGGLVSAGAGAQGWLSVAGAYIDSSTSDNSFGNARLLVDADKACDLALSVAEPGELVFRGSRPAALTARVTNVGTRACAGTVKLPAPYRMSPVSTGVLLPGATFTAAARPVVYAGPRRADDVLTVVLDASADANTANNRAFAHVAFSYCDLVLEPIGGAGAIPTEGKRRFELLLSNSGTATCAVRVASGARYRLPRGRTVSDELAVAAPRRARPGRRVRVVLRASAAGDVNPRDNAVAVWPTVVKVGDSEIRARGARGLAGTSRRGDGDLPARRLRPARVDVAVLRQGGKRCSWLRSVDARFTRQGRCGRPRWLRAEGTASWRLELRRRLPAGRYVAYSRVTIGAGFPEARFSAKDRNKVAFRVR